MPKTFNQPKFAKFCRTVTQSDIADKLGLKSRQLVSHRLRNLDKLTVVDFLAICELIDEQPESFIEQQSARVVE